MTRGGAVFELKSFAEVLQRHHSTPNTSFLATARAKPELAVTCPCPPWQEWQQWQGFHKPLPITLMGDFSDSLSFLSSLSFSEGDKYIYPLVMNTGSDSTCKWACQWPIGLTQTTTDSGYQCQHPICVTACVYIRRHRGWPMPRPIEIVTKWHFGAGYTAHLGVTFFG